MSKARQHAEDRLRTHLMKRHKVKDRKTALCRFPRRNLYEHYGLYKVSGKAGWNLGACPGVKNIGKPYAGKPHVRFDEGRLMNDRAGGHVVVACDEASIKDLTFIREVSFLLYPILLVQNTLYLHFLKV